MGVLSPRAATVGAMGVLTPKLMPLLTIPTVRICSSPVIAFASRTFTKAAKHVTVKYECTPRTCSIDIYDL